MVSLPYTKVVPSRDMTSKFERLHISKHMTSAKCDLILEKIIMIDEYIG